MRCNHKENELVVLGAYRRSELSRWFKTNIADTLMKELNTPLFIAQVAVHSHNLKYTIMLSKLQTHNMTPVIYKENISQKLLMLKPILKIRERNINARKISKARTAFSAIGLVIPFQPPLWDEKSIHSVWNNGMEMMKAKLKGRYSEECINIIIDRLGKLFLKLNYNTHRKSLAIILAPEEEKIFYLSYRVKPLTFSSQSVTLFDLAVNIEQEPEFYFLLLNEESTSLYDYNNNRLRKVYECGKVSSPVILFKKAANTIELLNANYEKPVFVTGRLNMVEGLCNSTPYFKRFFSLASPFSTEIIQSFTKEIVSHWDYWQLKFVKSKILVTKEAGHLVSNFDAVLNALSNCADGLLLVDKHLKKQLRKSGSAGVFFHLADEFMLQLEKFLARGNRVEITKSGLLKDMGGIVLLKENNKYQPSCWYSTTGGSLY